MPKKSSAQVELAGDLSLRSIAELKTRLVAALAAGAPLVIETGGVTSIDAGCLQVLVAAQKSANAAGTPMTLSAAAGGPLGRTLIAAGCLAADGRPLLAEAASWTLTREAR